MATSAKKQKAVTNKQPANNNLSLIWLDDSSEEDPNAKTIFLSLFNQVFTFIDTGACLEFVESAESEIPCLAVLVSGKYGQLLVHDRFQPLNQVKDIYVYCFDIAKHNQWAQQCDKVRCVNSDLNKILKHMQKDIQNSNPQPIEDQQQQQQQQQDEEEKKPPIQQKRECFMDDNNLFDQLALNLLLQSPDDDGVKDFDNYCRTHDENDNKEEEEEGEQQQQTYFKPEQSIREWYKPDLFFINLNLNDLHQLWTLRWFIRLFYRQLTNEYKHFIKDLTNFTVNYGTWLNIDEFDGMKQRIGEIIIITELLLTYTNRQKALNSLDEKKDEQSKYKVLFEINVNTNIQYTIPYNEIEKDQVLFWYGSRYRLMKIEYIEHEDAYWLIGLNLCSTFDKKSSIEILYEYYFKNLIELNDVYHAFGQILMYKGYYYQSEKWLQTTNHYQDLAELAIRQSEYERANQYLEHLSEDSYDANLLRAYVNILSSNDNITKGRTILMKICSEATDRIIRARANIALGFISLIITQQIDQALEYFTLGNESLCKFLPNIHPDIAKSYIGIGYTYFVQHNIKDAQKYFDIALKIQKQSLTYNHPDIAKSKNGRAHCLSNQKQTIKQALNEFEYALNILIDTFQHEYKHHPEILATINDIERLRKGKDLGARNTLLDYI